MNRRERREFAKQAPKKMRKEVERALKDVELPEPEPSMLEKAGFVLAKPRIWTP